VESHIEGFPMIEELLGKTAGSPESPPEPMPQPAVISLYSNCVHFVG
jgi:hypothetical protein